jgi:CheY-like chemotaxis protein
MPGMTGGQLIRSVREMSSAACIVLTGSDGNGVEQDAMAGGAVAVLRKPTPPERILQLVGALLRPQHGTPNTGPQSPNRVEKTSTRRAAGFC